MSLFVMCDTQVIIWHEIIIGFLSVSLSLSDCNTEGSSSSSSSSSDGDMGLCGEGQLDFRSILSYGVQEPWVNLWAISVLLKYLHFL